MTQATILSYYSPFLNSPSNHKHGKSENLILTIVDSIGNFPLGKEYARNLFRISKVFLKGTLEYSQHLSILGMNILECLSILLEYSPLSLSSH